MAAESRNDPRHPLRIAVSRFLNKSARYRARTTRLRHRRLLEAELRPLLEQEDRIVAGPWLGEVGFEVLYWIPLLRWIVHEWPELRGRLVAVSRGGVAGWYEGIADSYVDLFEKYDHLTFQRRLEEERRYRRGRGAQSLKQSIETEWEQEIAAWVGDKLGESRMLLLHPSVLYRSLKLVPFLAEASDVAFSRWRQPERGRLEQFLPARYIAVRFYRNQMLGGEEGVEFAQATTRWLAERIPVVALNTEVLVDPRHPDFGGDAGVTSLATQIPFADNLGLQSVAIANAEAFVGTAGGLSFVAPNYGVASFGFWSVTSKGSPESKKGVWRDLDLAAHAYSRPGLGGYTALSCEDGAVRQLLEGVVA